VILIYFFAKVNKKSQNAYLLQNFYVILHALTGQGCLLNPLSLGKRAVVLAIIKTRQ
jgi:hypothetical protein